MLPLLQRLTLFVISIGVAWWLGNGYSPDTQGWCSHLPSFVQPLLSCPKWNLLYHLGGNGPWVPKRDATPLDSITLPQGCAIDQVHMLSRHAERYPTKAAGERQLQLLQRLRSKGKPFQGSLSFLNKWKYFANGSDSSFENLIRTGPYAGTTQAQRTGRKFQERYGSLLNKKKPLNFWSCDSARDIETAQNFAHGFFGSPSWSTDGSGYLHIIPETENRGGDTLTPGKTCTRNNLDDETGRQRGYEATGKWQKTFTKPITEKFSEYRPGFNFTSDDIYTMMEMCGFEILARGSSPWCDLFTKAEWLDFEYARDLLHFYRSGPGNEYAGTMGYLWLEATRKLISNQTAGGLYFSFVHDGDILPLLAALRYGEGREELNSFTLIYNAPHLPVDRLEPVRNWRTSDIVPMGGRVVLERIDCRKSPFSQPFNQTLIRLSINDGVVNLDKQYFTTSKDRWQHGMPLEDFEFYVSTLGVQFGHFRLICEVDEGVPEKISFLHQ